ncbi:MAG TPA: TIGR03118 family protein [Caulobacteraceae bacterium]|nr:TIGR03118 family protein [Caulobacteraceae bacterium]
MSKFRARLAWLAVGASALALAACGGGGGGGGAMGGNGYPTAPPPPPTPAPPPPPPPSAATSYSETSLVSDQAGQALHQDTHLVDAWGIVMAPGAAVWVNDNGTNVSTLYDGNGVAQNLVVTIPPGTSTTNIPGGTANPTGIVFNGTSGFPVNGGPASFIFVGEEGTISGWANGTAAVKVVDNSAAGAVYKGVGIFTPSSGASLLFVANFHAGTVDVFDSNFHPTTVPNGFTDPNLPAGYAPFNVQVINNMVFVAYAQQNSTGSPANFNENDGAGLGFVDEFDTTGKFIMRFDAPGGHLNAPWGLAVAPAGFGSLSGDLLVGNFGDGTISAYNLSTGAYAGKLMTGTNTTFSVAGLWGIEFGNGSFSQPTTTLFFAAGPNMETHGLYGRLDLPGAYTAPSSTPPPPTGPGYGGG